MVIELPPELEASLGEIAQYEGISVQSLVVDLASEFLRKDRRFREGVDEGLAQANVRQFVSEEDMHALWKRLLDQP